MQYRREIDGLRALAVLPVLFFHAGFAGFNGGFVGVDIFFVISGYLITAILVEELDAGRFSIVSFYERRARRILPALFLVMLVCLPLAWFFLLPADLEDFSYSLMAVVAFISNVFFWWTSDYFAAAAELKPLLHTWSLAVEEQYYLFYPVLLFGIWRLGRRGVFWVLLVAIALSLAMAQIGIARKPVAAFYMLPTRAWELLLGAVVVFLMPRIDAVFKEMAAAAEFAAALGLVLIVYAIVVFDKSTPFPGVHALVPTVGTALIIGFATPVTRVGRVLGWEPFVKIGLISYSAYLWHQPLIAFVRHEAVSAPEPWLLAAAIAASLALAYLSWRYVERPFRVKGAFSRRRIFMFSAIGLLFFAGVGLVGAVSKGFVNRLPAVLAGVDVEMPRSDNGWCFYSVDSNAGLTVGSAGAACWLGDRGAKTKALLFGDSFAGQYEPLWNLVGVKSGFAINSITTNWCFPALDDEFIGPKTSVAFRQCKYNRELIAGVIGNYDFAVVAGHWAKVAEQDQLQATMRLVDWLSTRVKFVVVMPSPRLYDSNIAAYYKKAYLRGAAFDASKVGVERDREAEAAGQLLKAHFSGRGNVLLLDRADLFSINGRISDVTAAGMPFSLEGTHLSVAGSKAAAAGFMRSDAYARFERLLSSEAASR